ncbi:MAG: FAD-dependent oxidoreductase [Bacilli bacterium]|jgi:NADPH-dependent 2,4-dienoyl-CoA reductase/sulfur reductase-like enzyme
MREIELAIIGGGSAGLAAAISAYDNGVKNIIVFEKEERLGGILNQCIHNGFGLHTFKEELTGPEYAYRFIEEFNKRGIVAKLNTLVLSLSKDKVITYSNSEDGISQVKAKAVVFAAGCNERTQGQILIPGDRPKGVYTAGLAQKYLNIEGYLVGKNVYILGSGDIGLIMARRMTLEGCKVIGVSELMPYSNGLNRNIVQCLNDFNIPLRLHNTVSRIIGKDKLEAIEICDVDDKLQPIKGREQIIKCDCLLLSVGLYPFNVLLNQAGAKFNARTKGAEVDQNLETSIDGIFSCGNVLHVHDLVDFVSEEGTNAGKNAAEYVKNPNKPVIKTIEVEAVNNLGYVLPNVIKVTEDLKEVNFSFRVRKPMKKSFIYVKDEDKVLKKIMKPTLIPSQMEKVNLKDVDFKSINKISVTVEEN